MTVSWQGLESKQIRLFLILDGRNAEKPCLYGKYAVFSQLNFFSVQIKSAHLPRRKPLKPAN
ncbi:hypothetical protein CDG68_08630 [Acinetobacter wuhouensis]|uniref:Uncharacterized protein n=1 Tax=Acinetobacter wuhouensis TaxID=1879050 RepID=A0A3G2T1I3_9GAMM|nr:hypothetical protein CDG68_08630 [Acinetobacter wuhouensis]